MTVHFKFQAAYCASICCVVLGLLISPGTLAAQTEVTWKTIVDAGSPTIRYEWLYRGYYKYEEVRYVTYAGEPAFRFHVWADKINFGFLYISRNRMTLEPKDESQSKHALRFSIAEIKYRPADRVLILSPPRGRAITIQPIWIPDPKSGNSIPADALVDDTLMEVGERATVTWMMSALSDFTETQQQFVQKTSRDFLYPGAIEKFRAQADEWRALAVKPSMPESAREHKVLAENAVQEKNSDKAIDEYEAALNVFPTWPEGQFNMALICGETGDYACAVEHMQNYLALVPDAPDAQAAKDKLIIWKDKIAHSQ